MRRDFILTQGKAGAAVVAGGCALSALDEFFRNYCQGYLAMDYQETFALKGNIPRVSRGYGEERPGSDFSREYGPGAKMTPDKRGDPARDPEARVRARLLGEAIYQAAQKRPRELRNDPFA